MIVQKNFTPLVILALLILGGCTISGMLLGNVGPFNSKIFEANIPIQQTQGALDSLATQSAMELVQTQQAPMIQQTSIVAQMTTIPIQQTATQVAVLDAFQFAQVNATQTIIAGEIRNSQVMVQATQTSIANELFMQNLSNNATATAIEQGQVQNRATGFTSLAVVGIGMTVVCGWIVSRSVAQIITSRAREKVAQAQLLAEQRRLVTLRANIQFQKGLQNPQHPISGFLMQKSDNMK